VFDAEGLYEAIVGVAPRHLVLKRGRVVVTGGRTVGPLSSSLP